MKGTDLLVEQINDREWRLLRDLVWEGDTDRFTVTAGFTTNFASVPRPFWWLIPRTGKYTRAVVLHDAMWCASQKDPAERKVDPWDADAIFRRTLKELGVSQLRRYLMWAAVRSAAVAKGRFGRIGPIQILPLALIVIPTAMFLGPALVIVIGSLLAFWLIEWLVRLALKPFRVKRDRPELFWWSTERTTVGTGRRNCHLTVERLS